MSAVYKTVGCQDEGVRSVGHPGARAVFSLIVFRIAERRDDEILCGQCTLCCSCSEQT